MLDLAFDVDFLKSGTLGCFEDQTCLASQDAKAVFLLLEEMLAVVITDELGCVAVGFETEFLGNES
jgi:hypothetical protein